MSEKGQSESSDQTKDETTFELSDTDTDDWETMDIDEFLFDLHNRGELDLDFKPLNKNITLHTACHSRAQNIGSKSFSFILT